MAFVLGEPIGLNLSSAKVLAVSSAVSLFYLQLLFWSNMRTGPVHPDPMNSPVSRNNAHNDLRRQTVASVSGSHLAPITGAQSTHCSVNYLKALRLDGDRHEKNLEEWNHETQPKTSTYDRFPKGDVGTILPCTARRSLEESMWKRIATAEMKREDLGMSSSWGSYGDEVPGVSD